MLKTWRRCFPGARLAGSFRKSSGLFLRSFQLARLRGRRQGCVEEGRLLLSTLLWCLVVYWGLKEYCSQCLCSITERRGQTIILVHRSSSQACSLGGGLILLLVPVGYSHLSSLSCLWCCALGGAQFWVCCSSLILSLHIVSKGRMEGACRRSWDLSWEDTAGENVLLLHECPLAPFC